MPRVYLQYVVNIKPGQIVSRSDMAQHFGVHITTATRHLEKAVKAGLLNKQIGWVGRQGGWLYAHPEDMPRLLED